MFLNRYLTGILYLILPIFLFFNTNNIDLLSKKEILLILNFHLILIFFLSILSLLLIYLISKFKKKRNYDFFIIIFFGFYLLYFYEYIENFFIIIGIQNFKFLYSCFVLLIIYIIISFFFISNKIFNMFFIRFTYIFTFIIFASFCYSYTSNFFFDKKIEINNDYKNEFKNDFLSTVKNNNNDFNIYYLIVDEMTSIDLAKEAKLIKKNDSLLNFINKPNVNVLENSYSSYKSTYLSLTSIMNLDYPVDEKSKEYNEYQKYFPLMMEDNRIFLLDILKRLDYDFFWAGNFLMPCKENLKYNKYNCLSNKYTKIYSLLFNGIYGGTPFSKIFSRVVLEIESKSLSGQRNIDLLINHLKDNKPKKSFYFIHQLSPHSPFTVKDDCTSVPEFFFNNEYDGYKNAYKCVLQEISEFLNFIDKNDPNSIIVIQGDHGIDTIFDNLTTDQRYKYKASIFNLLRAPEICFDTNINLLRNNINTVRWAVNCISKNKLEYKDIIHYRYEHDDEYMMKINIDNLN